jgi:hypothetical protein
MSALPIEHAEETRVALREIVAEHGVGALSQPVLFTSLLSDLLPGAPGVSRILTAAAQDRIADRLREHVAQGMDTATAVRLTAHSFASATMVTPEVCEWVVTEFAVALGLLPGAGGPATGGGATDVSDARTIMPDRGVADQPPTRRRPPDAGDPAEKTDAGPDAVTRTVDEPTPTLKPQPTTVLAGLSRRTVTSIAAAGTLAVVLVALLIAAPWRTAPVLQPTGLNATATGTTTVGLTWQGPATGPPPAKYLVLVNGSSSGSIPGTDTSCTVRDLNPDTGYRFQLVAVRDGHRSVRSAAITADTEQPSISAAVLSGSFTAHEHVVKSEPQLPHIFSVGSTFTDPWSFAANCSSGPCSSVLSARINGVAIDVTLHPSGATYTGTASSNKLEKCGTSSSYPIHSTVHLRITVTAAGAVGSLWEASAWSGTVVVHDALTPAGAVQCLADSWTAAVHS